MNKKASLLCFIMIMVVFLLTACSRSSADVTAIKSVKYDTESGKIKINATMDKDTLREYKHKTIYLIEVAAGNESDDISTLIPISRAKADDEMKFSLPLKDGARTILYSGFVLAAFDNEKGYTALSDVHYIDNPEALAKNTEKYPEYASIKGLYIVSSSDATSLGVSHTTIRIPIEEYILPESKENAITFIFDGESHYYNEEKISELDYKIKNLTGSGIEVFLEFTLDTSKKELPSALSCLASTADAATELDVHYAISVSTGEAYRHMAAFFEFFAERYTRQDKKYGFAASYIIGHGVNSTLDTNIDDERTLSDSTARYGELLRIAHTALLSKYSSGKVFISLDNKWTLDLENGEGEETEEPLPTPRRHTFGGAEFINSLKNTLDYGGEIDFGVAIIPTASDASSMVWNDAGATNSADTEFVTMKNISVVRDFIGEETDLLLYNYGISSSDEASQAASYAYAYMKAIEADATAFIYNGHWDGATGNSETGLWRVGADGGASEKREIYRVFEEIDVKGAEEPESAKLRIGSEWRELWEKNSKKAKVVSRSDSAGTTVLGDKNGKTETSVLFDFSDGKNHNFFPSDSSYYIEICDYLGEKALKSGLFPKYLGENMGVRSSPISFEKLDGAVRITVTLNVESKIGNTSDVTLALSQSGSDAKIFHTSSVTVQSSNRQTVYFDASDADLKKENGDVVLYLWVKSNLSRSPVYSSQDATSEGEISLYIEDINVTLKKSGIGVLWTIIIVIGILLILAFGAYLFIKYRLAPPPKNTRSRPVYPDRNRVSRSGIRHSGQMRGRPTPPNVRQAGYPPRARTNNNGQGPRQVAPRSYEERRYYEQQRTRQYTGREGIQPRMRPNSDNIDHRRR